MGNLWSLAARIVKARPVINNKWLFGLKNIEKMVPSVVSPWKWLSKRGEFLGTPRFQTRPSAGAGDCLSNFGTLTWEGFLLCMGYPPKIPKDIQKSYLIDIKWSCFVHLHSDCLIMPVSETPGSLYDRDNPKSRCLFLNPSRSYAFAHPSRDLPSNYWMHHLRTRNWHEVSQSLNRTG